MPKRTSARLRDLRTAEAHLTYQTERATALLRGMEDVRALLQSGASAEAVVDRVREAIRTVDTSLAVAERLHQLRLQELQGITKFPDEN